MNLSSRPVCMLGVLVAAFAPLTAAREIPADDRGRISIAFAPGVAASLGIRVEPGGATEPTIVHRPVTNTGAFRVTRSADDTPELAGRAFIGGPGLTLTGPDGIVRASQLALRFGRAGPRERWSIEGQLRESSTTVPLFDLDTILVDTAPRDHVRIGGELRIADALAEALGQPETTGTLIGRLSAVVARPEAADYEAQPIVGSDAAATSVADGPDVIVGALIGARYYDTMSGESSFSIGTLSCNAGDVPLKWIASTNEHPVISTSVFRMSEGRFEQIGMSWLKHGFAALAGNECAFGCQDPGTTSVLGIGCSDPYSASLNGQQSNLGPRSEVNAHNGSFPYPPNLSPPVWNELGRRLRVYDADIDPAFNPDARYFAQAHYVTADDAAAGHQDNNAAYHEVEFIPDAGGWILSLLAQPTQREKPAIRAWADHDGDVLETDVRVPGEGLFILAAKVTDLGAGYFRYEYALQNLNSDRSAGSFEVPVDLTADVRSVGFHDVDYHSGEVFDGTDWQPVLTADTITWTTDGYNVNPNANALRWGTLYNFRFEVDLPPQPTTVTLGLFKPGSPETVDATTVGPLRNAADCNGNGVADSLDILEGTSLDCNANDIPDECEDFAEGALAAELVASGLTNPVYITSPPGNADRLFIVEQGGVIRLLSGGSSLATPFLDISSLVTSGGEQGLLSMAFHPDYAANGLFYVNHTDLNGDTVIAQYSVSGDPDVASPGSAVALKQIAQDFANHNGGQLHFGPDGHLYVGMGDGGDANDPANRAQDTSSLLGKMLRLDVDNPPTYVPADNPFVGSGLPLDEIWAVGLRNPWRFSFDRVSGDVYITDVGQAAFEEINFQPAASNGGENYGWRCMEGFSCTGLSGCTCNSPSLTIPILDYPHDDGACSITGGYVYRGCAMPFLHGTYFYADFCTGFIRSFRYEDGIVTDERDRTAELTPDSGPIDAIVSFGEDAHGELYVVSHFGDIYKIVPAIAATCGNGLLEGDEQCDDGNTTPGDGCDENCQLEDGNPNDDCSFRRSITNGDYPFFTNGAGTDGPDEPGLCDYKGDSQINADLWYCYTASCSGTVTIDLCDANFDTKVAVYEGCDCPTTASAAACNDDGCGAQSLLSFQATACSRYLIRVGGFETEQGSGTLSITCDPDPIVNDCNNNGVDDSVDIACGDSFDADENGIPDECETQGDYVRGGLMYDRWWSVVGVAPPATDQPLWAFRPDQTSNTAAGSATWRCKECHGWDYKGVDGQYGTGPHRTGFAGILDTALAPSQLVTLLKEPPSNGGGTGVLNGHDYGSVLTDAEIDDLVAFVFLGLLDNDPFINPTSGAFNGDPVQGETNYSARGTIACISCHGAEGTSINFGTADDPEYVGTVAVNNPWELLHKIRFGQPGTAMPSWLAAGETDQGAADIGRYAQLEFPTECAQDSHCDDGIDCTVDVCDDRGRCQSTPSDALCPDDGLFCTGPEVCDAGLGCVSLGNPCSLPGACDEGSQDCGCATPAASVAGSRYLAITPQTTDPTVPVAIRITPQCPGAAPVYARAPSGPDNIAAVTADPSVAARLTPASWGGTVYVTGLDIVPDTEYGVAGDCGMIETPVLTELVVAGRTHRWGDVAGTFEDGAWTPPDEHVDIRDILALLDGFSQHPAAPPLPMLDLVGCSPDQVVDVRDVIAALNAFAQRSYAEVSGCPVPCS